MYSTFSVVVVAVVLGLSASVDAQELSRQAKFLIGIGPIRIDVGIPSGEAQTNKANKRSGLTKELVRNAVELSLRRNGIPISESAMPVLSVRVFTLGMQGPTLYHFVYCIEFKLLQAATLEGTFESIFAIIWENTLIGHSPSEKVPNQIRIGVLNLTDHLSLDYLRANPTSKKNPLDAVKP